MNELKNLVGFLCNRLEQSLYYGAVNGLYIERYNNTKLNLSYEVCALNKKSEIIYQKNCKMDDVLDVDIQILTSYLVIFSINYYFRNNLLKILGKFCHKHKCYGPIVYADSGEILFFPKLRYQDSLLIKDIVSNQLKNENYLIAYGGDKDMVVI